MRLAPFSISLTAGCVGYKQSLVGAGSFKHCAIKGVDMFLTKAKSSASARPSMSSI
jgi:hypothetical protein